MKLSVSTKIHSSPDKVWQAISDVESCSKWIKGIINITITNKPETGLVGLKWTETRKMFGNEATENIWVIDSIDGESYTTQAQDCGVNYISKLTITSQGDDCLLTIEFSGSSDSFLVNLMSSIMGFFMKKTMIKMLEDDLSDIKKYVELSD